MPTNWEMFFKENEDYRIGYAFYQKGSTFTVEELYQAFKERLFILSLLSES